ncbi:MFS transporter [Rhodoluna sp.]|uniref:MFS transporter n=1 Tax=Rhodoluna sp. TaxID=1969481 RepID=UPI0025D13643|nr:MFS transporter [Rhodoluna sp.]
MALTAARAKTVGNSILAMFFIQGFVQTTYLPRIPELIKQLEVSFTTWGLIIGLSGAGGILGLIFTNRLISRFGTKVMTIVGGSLQAAFLGALAFTNSPFIFFVLQAAMGFAGSMLNIALNSQSVALQKALNKVVIGKFHAAWSIGAASSAGIAGFFATFMPLTIHLTLIPLVGIVVIFLAGSKMLSGAEDGHGKSGKASKASTAKKIPFFKSPGQVWLLAAGLFTGVFGELAMMDWSAVFAKTTMGLEPGVGAIPYTAFATTMIIGRLSIGRLTKRFHISDLSRIGGLVGSVAMMSGVLAGALLSSTDKTLALVVASALFALAGLGTAPLVPSFFSAAGYVKGLNTAQVLARMSLVNTLVVLVAKIALGALAESAGLVIAFIFPTTMMLFAALIAGVVAKRAKSNEAAANAFPATGAMSIIQE